MHCVGSAGPSAVTDVSGFGLIGHSLEMAARSSVCVELSVSRLPSIEGSRQLSDAGLRTSGHKANW